MIRFDSIGFDSIGLHFGQPGLVSIPTAVSFPMGSNCSGFQEFVDGSKRMKAAKKELLGYAELHCHSSFSLLDGANNPEDLALRAKELGLGALAITDHDDLGGAVRFAYAARELELDAIIGAEITLEDDSHITLLAEAEEGYKNLCRLITYGRAHCDRGSPRVPYEVLFDSSAGLIALSGCPRGSIPTALARGDGARARRLAATFQETFSDSFYFELWNHHLRQESLIARHLLELSRESSIPWTVTNNVHYARPEGRAIHDVLTCLRHETTLAEAGRRLRPNGSWYMKSPEEMVHLWRHNTEGIKNTLVIAERCGFRLSQLKTPLPVFTLPPEIMSSLGIEGDINHNALLEKLVWEGAGLRYSDLTSEHIRQIDHELSMIVSLDLAPYFLIMWDIVRFARSRGIAVQGRGSAANSAVCYCLMITAVDPVGMELLFERFLSEGRNEPPDIDLDIAHQEREIVLQYVYEKYGRKHAAMVCEVITYRGRSAVRDAARVLGFSQEQADRLSAEADRSEARDAAEKLQQGGLARVGLDPKDKRSKLLLEIVRGLHQLPRHRSIHVGGFVLSGRPLGELVPIEPAAMEGRTVIQWDKDDIDLAGMIKIDLLGLGMLTMIQEGLKLVKQFRGTDIDIGTLDMDDPAIYKMLQKADTVGLFQVESRAQMNILPRLMPRCFYDIIVSIAIVRPGPILGNIIHPYLRRRRGEEEVVYLHPSLEPILKRTLGVPLFQEQGMKLAVVAAGFTPSQADNLRRVMSHKRSVERMAKVCEELADGMARNNYPQEAIETITHQLRAFANYGFPESHAASFSLLVYASAYLKFYYGPEFYCAILNAQPMGFYSPASLIRDAIRHDVEVRPVDLAKSSWNCTLEVDDDVDSIEGVSDSDYGGSGYIDSISVLPQEFGKTGAEEFKFRQKNLLVSRLAGYSGDEHLAFRERNRRGSRPPALRLGLRYVEGLGRAARANLENAWRSGGQFRSLDDVIQRSGLEPSELKVLAQAGAFDSLFPGRRKALWKILGKLRKKMATPLLDALYELNGMDKPDGVGREIELPAMTEMEEVIADYRLLRLSTRGHPMKYHRNWAEESGVFSCIQLSRRIDGEEVSVAGCVICRQRPATAKGFVFLTLEDETGMANVVVKPKVFARYKSLVMNSSFLVIQGQLQIEQGVANVVARHLEELRSMPQEPEIRSRDFH